VLGLPVGAGGGIIHAVTRHTWWGWLGLALVLLLGLGLRLAPWGDHRFLEDEALYAYWGLQIATGADPMLDAEPVDKPPLHPYVLGLSFWALGRSETAARLPSLLASLAGMGLLYVLGRSAWRPATAPLSGPPASRGERVGLLAALLLALSPFDILFASTAFTDPLLVAGILAAAAAAAAGRLGLAGGLMGLAVATKQQGWLFVPLVVGLGLRRASRRGWLGFGAALGLVAGGTWIWDACRAQRPGYWAQGIISYGGLDLAPPAVWPERLGEWLGWLRYLGGSAAANATGAALVAGVLILGLRDLLRARRGRDVGQGYKTDLLLLGFAGLFVGFHVVVDVQLWDRYILGLAPLAALLVSRGVERLRALVPASGSVWASWVGAALLAGLLAGPALTATHSGYPVGGDHGAYDGIDRVAATLRTASKEETRTSVIYHHWLGYHYRFYLYGAPVRTHWWPDLADLTEDARIYRREARWIAFPAWVEEAPARVALAGAEMRLWPVLETRREDGSVSFRLYRIEGP
jgi:4-amino-4-deoxy-L-arabinose transferase-like glycosyltransferase